MTASQAADMARILIAEDEETLRNLLRRALVEVGHGVLTAADGAEALDILTREKGDFDLLLTDIKMPVMDGIALALAAARDFPDVVILLMTGYADQRERANGLDALIHGVETKPISLAEIKFEVASALASRMRTPAR
jgi:CheY-like chemotaxis protein